MADAGVERSCPSTGATAVSNGGVLTGREEGIRDVVTSFWICWVVFAFEPFACARVVRLEVSVFYGSRPMRNILAMWAAVPKH